MEDIKATMKQIAQEFEQCRPSFTALGDENRQHILIALLQHYGGMRVGEIAEKINLSRPAVSHHLKILMDTKIISMYKKGTMNFYHMDSRQSQMAEIGSLMQHVKELLVKIEKVGCCNSEE